jgi:hypothetical protein
MISHLRLHWFSSYQCLKESQRAHITWSLSKLEVITAWVGSHIYLENLQLKKQVVS